MGLQLVLLDGNFPGNNFGFFGCGRWLLGVSQYFHYPLPYFNRSVLDSKERTDEYSQITTSQSKS